MEFSAIKNKAYWLSTMALKYIQIQSLNKPLRDIRFQKEFTMTWILFNLDHQNDVACADKRVTLDEDALLYLLHLLTDLVKAIKLMLLLIYLFQAIV